MEELDQIKKMAQLLASLPSNVENGPRVPLAAPMRTKWATELVREFGVRVHPDLATKQLVPDGPAAGLGAYAPQRKDDALDVDFVLKLLRESGVPKLVELATNVELALRDPDPAKKDEVLAALRREYPDVVATARHLAKQTPPAAYENAQL
jgi:uncharacterized protein YihD (DUF1040 family)